MTAADNNGKKYAAIQFTVDNYNEIVRLQKLMQSELGAHLSVAQTVVYCLNQFTKNYTFDGLTKTGNGDGRE